jgi:DNA polymerase I
MWCCGRRSAPWDLIKLAMIAVQGWLESAKLQTKLVMQVHDELVFEVPVAELEVVKASVPGLMVNVEKLDVPLVTEPEIWANWEEAHLLKCGRGR